MLYLGHVPCGSFGVHVHQREGSKGKRRLAELRDATVSHECLYSLNLCHGPNVPPTHYLAAIRLRLGAPAIETQMLCPRTTRLAHRNRAPPPCPLSRRLTPAPLPLPPVPWIGRICLVCLRIRLPHAMPTLPRYPCRRWFPQCHRRLRHRQPNSPRSKRKWRL